MLAALLAGGTTYLFAQEESKQQHPLTIGGYAEVYYGQDLGRPVDNTRPQFLYSHNRTNEVTLNLAFLKATYSADRVRAGLSLAAGTYMNANYAAEAGVIKNIYEASVGVKLSGKQNLWLDAGIMPSHIGFESAVGKDNWTLTRSLVAENSPYYEAGVKLGYTSQNEQWYLAALYLNGWQRIRRVDGNTTPAFGLQVSYKPAPGVILNYSAFAGSDAPDTLQRMRYFHNLYGIFQLSDRFGITAGFDFGMQQTARSSDEFNNWYAPVLIVRYSPVARIAIAARLEYYNDENGVIITTGTPGGFQTTGISGNMDYRITPNVVCRIEVRNFYSKDRIFTERNGSMATTNTSMTTALAIAF